jgi:hypothetical protein
LIARFRSDINIDWKPSAHRKAHAGIGEGHPKRDLLMPFSGAALAILRDLREVAELVAAIIEHCQSRSLFLSDDTYRDIVRDRMPRVHCAKP